MSRANLSGDPGSSRAVASVPVPPAQAVALLGAASGAGWVGTSGERTVVVTDDPADATGVLAGASGLDRDGLGVTIWSCVAPDGERTGGFAVARGGVIARHTWSEVPDLDAAVGTAKQVVEVLGSEVEPYLLRALLRRTGDPEDLVVQALHLLDLDPRLHTLLVEGPPESFTWIAPSGGLDTWRDQIAPRSRGRFRGRFWSRRRR